MTGTRALLLWSGVLLLAVALLVGSRSGGRPRLARVLAHVGRAPVPDTAGWDTTVGVRLVRSPVLARLLPSEADLRVAGTTAPVLATHLLLAGVLGALLPLLVLGALRATGLLPLGLAVPALVSLVGAVLAPMVLHTAIVERAAIRRADLRHQLSAYLDVVTMLLAGNTGHEGALDQAARAGDGRLFRELRRRIREAGTAGDSLVTALAAAGADLGLPELEQVAATTALSAAEGSPVARTLAATCASLRSTLATDQETEARLRTSKLTPPIVGMALVFMALVVYPALQFG
jgi:Flp pilus assembly protein TadB